MTDKVDNNASGFEKETRFAVVMYGGVSLAIYIHGVAKELYSLVRATAWDDEKNNYRLPNSVDQQLKGAEVVYREIGKKLKTKFVVDILSGTSAGGINAIYLAKALANGQSMDMLKDLWINQGDIALLINDKDSKIEYSGLEIQNPPESLLNSQRMYFYLLHALHQMDMEKPPAQVANVSSFVEELDLHITATDIRGLEVQLPVSNAIVRELRFRNAYHFHYSTLKAAGVDSNDFVQENNPFLAFAARCTSSFPFAFEPMKLDDIKSVLQTSEFSGYKYLKSWEKFYKDYQKVSDDFSDRSFGDGGYIDNKPFSYATENLLRRRADLPVDRKLIYIDPAPEHPEENKTKIDKRPDAIENVQAALMSIPRYEPIREDLERVVERNQLIRRVNHLLGQIDHASNMRREIKPWQKDKDLWVKKYFDRELVNWFGPGYAAYHQLRVESVLEDLRIAMLRALNLDITGKQADDFHILMDTWRKAYYTTNPKLKRTHQSENDILYRLDTSYRMRRLHFIQGLINTLLKAVFLLREPPRKEPSPAPNREQDELLARARNIIKQSQIKWDISSKLDKNVLDEYVKELSDIKKGLNDIYVNLRASGRLLRAQNLVSALDDKKKDDLNSYLRGLKGLGETLGIYNNENETKQDQLNELANSARTFLIATTGKPDIKLTNVLTKFDGLVGLLAGKLPNGAKGYIGASLNAVRDGIYYGETNGKEKVKPVLGIAPKKRGDKDKRSLIQQCLSFYYERFEYYDMLTFPIQYGTDVEESDEVEIIRISPEDATNLVNEKLRKRKKLAGTKLASFGAFFKEEWRRNDMMWGRLDAAECLIKALMPEGDERAMKIEEAQLLILQEELISKDNVEVYKSRYGLTDTRAKWLYQAIHRLSAGTGNLMENFRGGYSIDNEFPPKETALSSTRAAKVVGKLLNGLSGKYSSFANPAKWLTAAGSIGAGIVQLALPGTPGNFLFMSYWVWVAYLLEITLWVGGTLFKNDAVLKMGAVLFSITFVVHMIVIILSNWMQGVLRKHKVLFFLLCLFAIPLVMAILVALTLGALDIWSLFKSGFWMPH